MIDVVLAAGYATRMYPLTENFPKPLLEIKGKTILDSLVEDIDGIPSITGHVVVSNHKFADRFMQWRDGVRLDKSVSVIDDGSTDNDHRLGAVCDFLLAMERCGFPDDDFLVVAADNLLDFSLSTFVDFFKEKGTSAIMCYDEPSVSALRRTGVITVDEDWKVTGMEEKPEIPKSNWAVPPFYIFSRNDLPLIRKCLENGCAPDAPGNLARFLCSRSVVHAFPMPGHRIDIGNLETYYKIR